MEIKETITWIVILIAVSLVVSYLTQPDSEYIFKYKIHLLLEAIKNKLG